MIIDKPDLVLEKILDLRTTGVAGNARREFLIQWENRPEESSWEPEETLWRWRKEIAEYNQMLPRSVGLPRTSMTQGGGVCNAHELDAHDSGESGALHGRT